MTSIKIDRFDGLSSSTAWKGPVRATTTTNILLTGLQTVDGVVLAAGDRVLVKDQTDQRMNGIWVCDTGPWRRVRDFNKTRDVMTGTQVFVVEGALYSRSGWYVSSPDPIYVGTSDIQFTQNELLNLEHLEQLVAAAEAAANSAANAEEAAEDAAERAEAAAAGVNLPSISIGDASTVLTVKADGSGYEFRSISVNVETRPALKALPVSFKAAFLREVGREGTFVLKVGSPPITDTREGLYVVSNTAGYYWERIITGSASAFWFGAVANGSTDDAPVVKDALLVVRDLLLPAKRPDGGLADYRFASTVTLNNGNCLRGDSSRSKITISPLMAVDVFHYVGTQITVKDLLVYGNRTQTNFLHKFRTDLMNCSVIDIDNVWSDGCAGIFSDANSTFLLTNLTVTKCTNTGVTGRSLDFRDALAFIFFRRVAFDYVGVTNPSSNTYAVYMANNEGAIFEDVDVLGGTKVGFSDRDGFRFENCRAIWLTRCMADHMGGWGFFVSDCDYVYFTTCTSSLCNKDQYYINTNSRWITATNCYAGGSNGETGAIAGVHGWLIENSIQVTVNGGTASNCTGKAIVTSGATTRFVGTGVAMIDNAGGNYTLGSTMSHLVGCTKADGTLTAYPTTNVSG
ncbi:right-handed parallel beta-helix repeat-containing protein [Brucella anthropi]|uniref:right-handed parallel beta-helix repeat-containing protein n=1 Tax=Brucella anthropi TaxID=529 RepID=UPI003D96A077